MALLERGAGTGSISEASSGKGFATEAVLAMTEYALRAFNIHVLYGRVLRGNTASERVLLKSGYTFLTCETNAPDDPYGDGMLVYRKKSSALF